MIETVVSVGMLVDEVMRIRKNRLIPDNQTGNLKRLCIVTGIHGDELGGQYICYEVIRRIKKEYHLLTGIVDVYPAMNPMGLASINRGIPFFDMDMNTVFPGSMDGTMAEYTASHIIEDMKGAEMCLDVHSSNLFVKEIPQVRINDDVAEKMLPYAKLLNTDMVWIHPSSTVMDGSLAYALNEIGVKTMVIEAGVALRIDYDYCNQLVTGIFSLMKELGIWQGEIEPVKKPIVSYDGEVVFVNAESAGIFVPAIKHSMTVKKNDKLGDIVDVITGSVEEEIIAPCDGLVFSLREYPAIEEGSLIARILGGGNL